MVATPPTDSPGDSRRTVLIALPDPAESEALAVQLRRYGLPLSVMATTYPAQARDAIDAGDPSRSILILDLDAAADRDAWMPWLRMSGQAVRVPIILRTASRDQPLQEFAARRLSVVAKSAGPDDFAREVCRYFELELPKIAPVRPMSRAFRAISAAIIWLTLGLTLGTLTLVGPAEATVAYGRAHQWSDGAERAAVIAWIVLLIVAVTLVALAVTRATKTRLTRLVVSATTVAFAVATVRVWMEPGMLRRLAANHVDVATVEVPGGARFDFGPLPTASDFLLLKAKGYSGVVMLLSPAVVPIEPAQMQAERGYASDTRMPLIEAPMLPWISSNDASLARIRELASVRGARYYVHCYLGRDRVRMVQRFLLANGAQASSLESSGAQPRETMERGELMPLADGVVLGPLPTQDELVSVILERKFSSVLSLLDTASADERQFFEEERRGLERFGLRPVAVSLNAERPDSTTVNRAVAQALALARPLYVHAFRTDSSARVREFLRAWRAAELGAARTGGATER